MRREVKARLDPAKRLEGYRAQSSKTVRMKALRRAIVVRAGRRRMTDASMRRARAAVARQLFVLWLYNYKQRPDRARIYQQDRYDLLAASNNAQK